MACCGDSGTCTCVLEGGAGITVEGSGSPATPYVISADGGSALDDSMAEVLGDSGSASSEVLRDLYASRATQDAVEVGYLNNGILTNRFGISHVFVGAEQMWAGQGAPTASTIANFTATWRFNSSTDQGAIFSRRLPREWATFDVYAVLANGGAGTGGVRIVGQWKNGDRDGELLTGGTSTGAGVITSIGVEHIQHTVRIRTGLTNDSTSRHHFRVYRTPTDASDTLGNDIELVGVLLLPVSFVTFEPEIPEEPEDLEGRTFTQAMNAFLDIAVHQQAGPPADNLDLTDFIHFPATAFSSRQSGIKTSTWVGDKWATIWDNRWNFGDAHSKKPNLVRQPAIEIGTKQARVVYSSQALANAATRSMVRHYLGMPTGDIQAPWTAAGGLVGNIITDAAFVASPETYCTEDFSDGGTVYRVATDIVVLPQYQLDASFEGIFLDYEPHDTRTPAETLTHISNLATDCHTAGYDLFLYTNVWNGDAMPYNGLGGTNAQDVLDAVDYMTLLLWAGNDEGSIEASYSNQVDIIETAGTLDAAQWAKMAIIWQIGPDSTGTTLADAEWVYNKMHEAGTDHPEIMVVWRDGADLGGSPERLTNRRISKSIFGTETPPGL